MSRFFNNLMKTAHMLSGNHGAQAGATYLRRVIIFLLGKFIMTAGPVLTRIEE